VKKSLFHFSSFKVKKVKSESDYFSRSNVWVWVWDFLSIWVWVLGVGIHWKAKNNQFRFSLSLFAFFTLRLFPVKWKSDFFTFTIAFEK